ncbi:MAG: EVE domain-containing protein [Candidatus Omnitrophica bacterium]|nr:EVE domain-containing protein [Candidatus Omnitrophota bacterium]
MNRWLFKTDPDTYSWSNLLKKSKEVWSGVHNPLALKHLRAVSPKDEILIYHTGKEKAVIGIAQAVSKSYPDPDEKDPKLAVVDIQAVKPLKRPVLLSEVKANPKLKSWELVRFSRLSMMPVTEEQWREVLQMSGK